MKFDNIIIVSDIDGTFVDDDANLVQRNVSAIEYFKENGGMFTFATGRCAKEVKLAIPMCDELCNIPSIMGNGSYFFDYSSHEKIHIKYLDGIIVDIVDVVLEKYPEVAIRAAYGDTYITPSMSSQDMEELKKFAVNIDEVDFHTVDRNKFYKCVFCAAPSTLEIIRQWLEKEYSHLFYFSSSSDHFFEVLPVTKGDRLEDIKKAVGKPNAKLYAAGDFENDLTMLQMADCAVVPANGIDSLKKIPGAIIVCSNNDGAIADLIEILDKTYK